MGRHRNDPTGRARSAGDGATPDRGRGSRQVRRSSTGVSSVARGAGSGPHLLDSRTLQTDVPDRLRSQGRRRGEAGSEREPSSSWLMSVSQGSMRSTRHGGSSLDRNDEKLQGRVALRWNETKKETVLFVFGGKRPRKETLLVALA